MNAAIGQQREDDIPNTVMQAKMTLKRNPRVTFKSFVHIGITPVVIMIVEVNKKLKHVEHGTMTTTNIDYTISVTRLKQNVPDGQSITLARYQRQTEMVLMIYVSKTVSVSHLSKRTKYAPLQQEIRRDDGSSILIQTTVTLK